MKIILKSNLICDQLKKGRYVEDNVEIHINMWSIENYEDNIDIQIYVWSVKKRMIMLKIICVIN